MELLTGETCRRRASSPGRGLRRAAGRGIVTGDPALARLLHRDLSARNVRRGAISASAHRLRRAGVHRHRARCGRHAAVRAPEALQMQVLDARADCSRWGAGLLPARRSARVRRASPRGLARRLAFGTCAAVALGPGGAGGAQRADHAALVARSHGAAPSAAEVMRRLCAISGRRSRRISPSRARTHDAGPRGAGSAAGRVAQGLVAPEPGAGCGAADRGCRWQRRTRALDSCVLDGRLLGAQVVRADTSSSAAATGRWRARCARSCSSSRHKPRTRCCGRSRLARPVPAALHGQNVPSAAFPERNALIRGLRDFVLALAERERLLLVVDDADRIDEPSLAFWPRSPATPSRARWCWR